VRVCGHGRGDLARLDLDLGDPGEHELPYKRPVSTVAEDSGRQIRLALQEIVERDVDVADNDNKSRASPVHHGHTTWRCFAASAAEAKPHG
jgi:hypothetical protein